MIHNQLIALFAWRWERAKGETIISDTNYWYTNEPNIKEFDYDTRNICPITRKAYEACSSDPKYDCSVSNDFKCNGKPDAIHDLVHSTAINPSFRLKYDVFWWFRFVTENQYKINVSVKNLGLTPLNGARLVNLAKGTTAKASSMMISTVQIWEM